MQTGLIFADGTHVTVTKSNRSDTFTYSGAVWNRGRQGPNTVAVVIEHTARPGFSRPQVVAEIVNGALAHGTLTVD